MATENRYRRHLMACNFTITPVKTIAQFLEGDGYTREQMTEMCGIDIINLFNSAYDIVTLDGKRYRKITSCALLKNIQSINLPNANLYLGKGCYLIFEDGVQVSKLGSGSSYTFSSTTTSKAIIYYSLKSSNNYCAGIYSLNYNLGGNRFINPVWTFEPFAKLDNIGGRSHYNDNNLKQIHLSEIPIGYLIELRNCSSAKGTLHLRGKINNSADYIYPGLSQINEIIIDKECIAVPIIGIGSIYSNSSSPINIHIKFSNEFIFSNIALARNTMNIQISEDALKTYSWYKGVLIYNNNKIISASNLLETDDELEFDENITSISNLAFSKCGKIKKIDLSRTKITSLSIGCLAIGNTLTELILPETLTSITGSSTGYGLQKNAVIYSSNLEKLVIPESCTSIKNSFSICLQGTNGHIIDLPKNITISTGAFANTVIKELYLRWDSSTVDKIPTFGTEWPSYVFSWCIFKNCILHIPQGMTQDYADKGYNVGTYFIQIIDDL